jgi:glycogen debranching enzyme
LFTPTRAWRAAAGARISQGTIHIRRTRFIADRVYDRLRLRNYGDKPAEFEVEYTFGADFLDIFEVRGLHRRARGTLFAPKVSAGTLVFAYEGLDGVLRRTFVEFDQPPAEVDGGRVRFRVRLAPRDRAILRFTVTTAEVGAASAPERDFNLKLGGVRRAHDRWAAECTEVFTDNEEFTTLLRRSQLDLGLLLTDSPWGRVPFAGVPWFVTFFGRDAAITGLETLMLHPGIAVGAVRGLTRLQGAEENTFRDEQPGRIMHEIRRGELANLRAIPHTPYYGAVDTTPLYLLLLCETVAWTGDLEFFELLHEHVLAALEWIDRYGDVDGDGFVEYGVRNGAALSHQGWRNGRGAIAHADGSAPQGPIALAEVQGYVYLAKQRLAELFGQLGDVERSELLQSQADALKARFNETFWMDGEQYLAMALDGRKAQVGSVCSTAGHCLFSGIVADDYVPAVARRLLAPDLFCGWGVRTLSKTSLAHNPVSFYNGSVWPFDNAVIAYGLKKLGYVEEANRIVAGIFEAARHYTDMRLPELFCGFTRQSMTRPVSFPMACSPTAASAGAVFLMLQAMLGLYPAAEDNILYVRGPALPKWLGEVRLANLRIGRSTLSLRFHREGNQTVLSLLDKQGPARVVVVQ